MTGLKGLVMAKKKLSEAEKLALIGKMPVGELQFRRKMINFAIKTCMEAGDPQGQIGNYRQQLGRIDGEIKRRRTGKGQPAVVVEAKPGRMGARAKL